MTDEQREAVRLIRANYELWKTGTIKDGAFSFHVNNYLLILEQIISKNTWKDKEEILNPFKAIWPPYELVLYSDALKCMDEYAQLRTAELWKELTEVQSIRQQPESALSEERKARSKAKKKIKKKPCPKCEADFQRSFNEF